MSRTGFPRPVRVLIIERSQGRCERCALAKPGMQIHHRRPRGMGGSRRNATNSPANGLYLCEECHWTVERHRTLAMYWGLLVRQREDPTLVPVMRRGELVCLLDDGTYTIVKAAS